MIGIYMIKNKVNNKAYIGQSINIESRWYHHKKDLSNNSHGNTHLQNSWNKYGESNFEFTVLEECTKEELNDKEIYWISYFGGCNSSSLYNYRAGGDSGGSLSEETKQKLRVARLRQPTWNKGLTKDDPRVAKYVMKKGQFHHTEETKKHISEVIKQRYKDGAYDNVDYSKRPVMSKEKYKEISIKNSGRKRTTEQCNNISQGKLQANKIKKELGLPVRVNKKPILMKTTICAICGKEFTQRNSRYTKTCSKECRYKLSSTTLSNNKERKNEINKP